MINLLCDFVLASHLVVGIWCIHLLYDPEFDQVIEEMAEDDIEMQMVGHSFLKNMTLILMFVLAPAVVVATLYNMLFPLPEEETK